MKTKVVLLAVILMMMLKTTVYAATTQVDVKINGKVNNGGSVDIIFNVKDVSKLYAGSLEFTYDPSVMKVESINGGELIKTNNPKIMEFGGDTAKNGNIADYYFTCVGKVDGFTGSGNFVVIKASVLNQDKFNIYKKSLKIQLVERNVNNEMKDINFTISGDIKDETPPNNSGSTEPSNSSGKDPNNGSGTGTDKSGEVGKGQNNSSSAGNTSNSNGNNNANSTGENSGSKASTSTESKENKGFISTVIDNIKSIFSGSSDKADDKKQIDNSSADNNKPNNSSTNSSNDKSSVENKVSTSGDATKPVDHDSKKVNNNGMIAGVVIVIVLLVASGVFVIKKKNNKK
ncbi:hypothetical protein JHL18_25030 [Clostridium sp. YIM B02505]|uniref:Cohesin domain-containing protein n=1 Tax=Clostridium yunnanense TaxID=2800325 RepID=A0ABS1EWW3_9CLOT|nr:cohesin domain-containing protein [Clostridium yunnanense]MBK1813874.1 hypothetical protein [Clostridium yunnanense]